MKFMHTPNGSVHSRDRTVPLRPSRLSWLAATALAAGVAAATALIGAAPADGTPEATTSGHPQQLDKHWAYQPPQPVPVPPVRDQAWPRRALDFFILAKLEQAGLNPSPDAEPDVLLRRLHFDLIGLPPSADDLTGFQSAIEASGIEAAMADVVDQLLDSPRFGERWGRHWLDVARYAESSGMESNMTFPQAWRYRDYVIESFNDDLPFDRFIIEQLAGDLLPWQDEEKRARQLIATGFLALGPKGLGEQNPFQFMADMIDEQIDTVMQAFTATTLACARCHDHFSEPYDMRDYYAVAGIFASTDTRFGTSIGPGSQVASDFVVLPALDGQLIPNRGIPAGQVESMRKEREELVQQEKQGRAAAAEAMAEGRDPSEEFTLQQAISILWSVGRIDGRLKTVDDQGQPLPLAMGTLERDEPIDVPLLDRGEISRAGQPVPRGFPKPVTPAQTPEIPSDQSGRLQLAQWLTSPDHPQTSRVIVNRIWRHLIGQGLVRSTDNFGAEGDRPSHPELLDHLALEFIARDWSVKSMIREIALSRSYRQASTWRKQAFLQDPDNHLLWRGNKRRLEAEAIRDAMLHVSGDLDSEPPQGSLIATLGERAVSVIGFAREVKPDLDGSTHRSVYLPVLRDRLPDILDLFDFAEPSYVTGDRDTTNVPLQALYLLNSEFVMQRAASLAHRALAAADQAHDAHPSHKLTIDRLQAAAARAFALTYGREPDADESLLAAEFLTTLTATDELNRMEILTAYCQSLLAAAEFRHLD